MEEGKSVVKDIPFSVRDGVVTVTSRDFLSQATNPKHLKRGLSSVVKLCLSDCINESNMEVLERLIQELPNLRILDLSHNPLGREAATVIVRLCDQVDYVVIVGTNLVLPSKMDAGFLSQCHEKGLIFVLKDFANLDVFEDIARLLSEYLKFYGVSEKDCAKKFFETHKRFYKQKM